MTIVSAVWPSRVTSRSPVLHPRFEIEYVDEGYLFTREPMLDLAAERCPMVKLIFENRREEPQIPSADHAEAQASALVHYHPSLSLEIPRFGLIR